MLWKHQKKVDYLYPKERNSVTSLRKDVLRLSVRAYWKSKNLQRVLIGILACLDVFDITDKIFQTSANLNWSGIAVETSNFGYLWTSNLIFTRRKAYIGICKTGRLFYHYRFKTEKCNYVLTQKTCFSQ